MWKNDCFRTLENICDGWLNTKGGGEKEGSRN